MKLEVVSRSGKPITTLDINPDVSYSRALDQHPKSLQIPPGAQVGRSKTNAIPYPAADDRRGTEEEVSRA